MSELERNARKLLESVPHPTILFRGVPIERFCQDDIVKILGLMQVAAENGANLGQVVPKGMKWEVGQQVYWKGEVAIIQKLQQCSTDKTLAWLRMFGQQGTHCVNTKLLMPYNKKPGDPTFDF